MFLGGSFIFGFIQVGVDLKSVLLVLATPDRFPKPVRCKSSKRGMRYKKIKPIN